MWENTTHEEVHSTTDAMLGFPPHVSSSNLAPSSFLELEYNSHLVQMLALLHWAAVLGQFPLHTGTGIHFIPGTCSPVYAPQVYSTCPGAGAHVL